MASSRLLGDLSALQLSAELSKDSIVVLPLGAIEQHGQHLPLNTDFVVADAVSRAAVEKFGAETNAWLLPTLPFTKSNEHAWAAGTMWLSATTMMSVIDDIGRCVAATPAKKIMFINGHGGNSALMAMMNRELRLKYGLQTFLAHPHMPADQGGSSAESELGMGVHGGVDETSVMLHLRPDLVDMTLAVRHSNISCFIAYRHKIFITTNQKRFIQKIRRSVPQHSITFHFSNTKTSIICTTLNRLSCQRCSWS